MTDEGEIWPLNARLSAPAERLAPLAFVRAKLSRPAEVLVIVYATMIVLLLANPQALVNWLADRPQNAITEAANSAAGAVLNFASGLGLSAPYEDAREAFLKSGWIKRDRGRH